MAFWYERVPKAAVLRSADRDTVRPAECAKAILEADLSLEGIELQWIRPIEAFDAKCKNLEHRRQEFVTGIKSTLPCFSSPTELSGQMDALHEDVIEVRADLPLDEIAKTIAHELRHCWQAKHYGPSLAPDDQRADERDALQYEHKFARWLRERKIAPPYETKIQPA